MTPPDEAALFAAVEATWPAAATHEASGWLIRQGAGGGKRVSAATALNPDARIDDMEAAQAAIAQPALVMVRPCDAALDLRLEAAGYQLVDPVVILMAPVADLAQPIPPVSTITVDWPPLTVQREIWQAGGIGPGRVAVMERATGPKTAILGRAEDQPSGAAFAACHEKISMVHALEVSPRLRRRKSAVYMMRGAAHWAQSQGADWIAVLVTRANTAAGGLYASLGMRPVGHYHYRLKPFEEA